jgi:hypothetical protein
MAQTRPVSFAGNDLLDSDAPVTLFYRMSTDRNYRSRGFNNTPGLHAIITVELDAMCKTPGRTIVRSDDGSGAVLQIEDIVRILNAETKLGEGSLDSLYLTVYEKDPFAVAGPAPAALSSPAERARRQAAGEPVRTYDKSGCCAMQ